MNNIKKCIKETNIPQIFPKTNRYIDIHKKTNHIIMFVHLNHKLCFLGLSFMCIYIYIFYIAHWRTTQKHTNEHWSILIIKKTTISHRQPEWTRKLLIGKSQIIYKCKYIYKIIKNKNALNLSNNLYAIIYLRVFLSRQ